MLRAVCQFLRAVFAEVVKFDQAVLTAAFTAVVVVSEYACCSAVARAAYAAFCALVKVVIAEPIAVSRAVTAVPTHSILLVTLVEVTVPVVLEVCAKAGDVTANISPKEAMVTIVFCIILLKQLYKLIIL